MENNHKQEFNVAQQGICSGKIITLTTKQEVKVTKYEKGDLKTLQDQVSGPIVIVPVQAQLLAKLGVIAIINEEAMMQNLAPNYGASALYDSFDLGLIWGDICFVSENDGHLGPLNNLQYVRLQTLLPEIINAGAIIQAK